MKLQFISNIFVHRLNRPVRINAIGKELALLGNIGEIGHPRLDAFLKDCDSNFEKVYWVPGPLEWTTRKAKMLGQKEELLNICSAYRNIVPMVQTKIVRPNGVHILGTTLWSQESQPGFFFEDLQWLGHSVTVAPEAIILTHHTPRRNMSTLDSKIKFWLYGEGEKKELEGRFCCDPFTAHSLPEPESKDEVSPLSENSHNTNQ